MFDDGTVFDLNQSTGSTVLEPVIAELVKFNFYEYESTFPELDVLANSLDGIIAELEFVENSPVSTIKSTIDLNVLDLCSGFLGQKIMLILQKIVII